MAFRRGEPPPPPPIPPSVALLRAIGSLREAEDGEPITELDTIAANAGLVEVELWPIIHAGVRAGFILVDEDDAISLSPKGWAWYRWDADR